MLVPLPVFRWNWNLVALRTGWRWIDGAQAIESSKAYSNMAFVVSDRKHTIYSVACLCGNAQPSPDHLSSVWPNFHNPANLICLGLVSHMQSPPCPRLGVRGLEQKPQRRKRVRVWVAHRAITLALTDEDLLRYLRAFEQATRTCSKPTDPRMFCNLDG